MDISKIKSMTLDELKQSASDCNGDDLRGIFEWTKEPSLKFNRQTRKLNVSFKGQVISNRNQIWYTRIILESEDRDEVFMLEPDRVHSSEFSMDFEIFIPEKLNGKVLILEIIIAITGNGISLCEWKTTIPK
jgi:hypothetical protein